MDTKTENASNTSSIKKAYLEKRACFLRENFNKKTNELHKFIEEVSSSQFNPTKDEIIFAKSLAWMKEHISQDAAIADLAKELDISVRKIQRIFSFFLDRTYTSVLLDLRIEAAKEWLGYQKYSVGEVAYLVGIKDHAYFTYLFRKTVGMTPSEYRINLIQKQSMS